MNPLIMTLKSACLALAVVVLTATAVQAVPTTYVYTGNPFTIVSGDYTRRDRVHGSVTLSSPLEPNMNLTQVTPLAFSFFDGHQIAIPATSVSFFFLFATGPTGAITLWDFGFFTVHGDLGSVNRGTFPADAGLLVANGFGFNIDMPGRWRSVAGVPDAGSTFGLLSLSLTALGVAARQFKRAAA
jgi:hypothetical protein